MGLFIRDNRTIVPALRDPIPTSGPIDALIITSTGFTEPIDVGTFTEALAFLLANSSTGNSPTLDCDVQYGFRDSNNQTHFVDSGDSFTQITANTGNTPAIKKLTANFGKLIRFRLKIGGTNGAGYTVTMRLALKG